MAQWITQALILLHMLLYSVEMGDIPKSDEACPDQCSCDGSNKITIFCGYHADERFKRLRHVPKNIPIRTSVLSLRSNIIAKITEDSFQNLTSLTNLNMRQNHLVALPNGAFRDLYSLRSLNLADNKLSYLPDNAFEGLYSLEELYLNGNRLRKIPEKLFSGLKSLRRLDLHKNALQVFPDKALHATINLKGLWLNDNKLTSIEMNTFKNLKELEILYLSNNYLNSLDRNIFSSIASLKILFVNRNNLSVLPHGIFNSLPDDAKVSLLSNPFVCDCKLHWLKTWINKMRFIYSRNEIRCSYPSKLTGQSLVTIPNEQFICSRGQWSSWSIWSTCSKTCGRGSRISVRTCVTTVEGEGRAKCPGENYKRETCIDKQCPVHGGWAEWSAWTKCSKTCASGRKTRYRTCSNPAPQSGGSNCNGSTRESKECQLPDCPVKNIWSVWSAWSDCSVTCAFGRRTRTRLCLDVKSCKHNYSTESSSCYLGPCPVNGGWSSWSSWTACSVTCSKGVRRRIRTCNHPIPQYGGLLCEGNSTEVGACVLEPCPVNGAWSSWTQWSVCSKTCSNGQRLRKRTCNNPMPKYGGNNCSGASVLREPCIIRPCSEWSQWSKWTACSVSCGNGTQIRTRSCSYKDCSGQNNESRQCMKNVCPIDGGWASWSPWLPCSKSCSNGTKTRFRNCSEPTPQYGGEYCAGTSEEIEPCIATLCEGMWSVWSQWSKCSVSCSNGTRHRSRHCTTAGLPNHKQCKGISSHVEECHLRDCPTDGAWSLWGSWTPCSRTCSNGTRSRNRTCTNPKPSHGGKQCQGVRIESTVCILNDCIEYEWSLWSAWSNCSGTCDDAFRTRNRSCTEKSRLVNNSYCSGNNSQYMSCNLTYCTFIPSWNSWSSWTPCSATCGLGRQDRLRNCSSSSYNNNAKMCTGARVESRSCYLMDCVTPQGWSSWSNWTSCSRTCGYGIQVRSRFCRGNKECRGEGLMVRSCQLKSCDILRSNQISWLPWTQWTKCSATCGRGHQMKWRFCFVPNSNSSKCSSAAPFEVHSRICMIKPCNYSSVWTTWTKWEGCAKSCHAGGVRKRVRYCLSKAVGIKCKGKAVDIRPCNKSDCQATKPPATYPPLVELGSPIPCPDPGTPRNGNRKFIDQIQYGSYYVAYTCNNHFSINGPKLRHCENNNQWSDVLPECRPICGKSSNVFAHRRLRIVGGGPTMPGAWPWQVALEFDTFQPTFNSFHCGGTLIAENWVVTAAHCVVYKDSKIPYHGVRVYLGVHDITRRHWDRNVQIVPSAQIIAHPKFNWKTYDSDIAVIRLRWRVNITDFVKPICLPNGFQRRSMKPGKKGTMLGWGTTESRKPATKLREVMLPIVDHKDCKKAYENETWPVTSNMLCAGFKLQSKDSCNRDSGGGFTLFDQRARKRRWFLAGIISWGNPKCGIPGKYSVFTKMTHSFVRWIRHQMNKFKHKED